MSSNHVILTLPNGNTIEMPILEGSLGHHVIDIKELSKQGYFTFDPGFVSTASCRSNITFIDGDKGILLHKGYAIEELANQSHFLEVCFLLLKGRLPNLEENQQFIHKIKNHTMVVEQISSFLQGFRYNAHPMAMLSSVTAALSSFYQSNDYTNEEQQDLAAIRLISKMPTIAAMIYKYRIGQPFVYPKNDLSFAGNFLNMMFSVPSEEYHINPIIENAMDKIFILHADHEQNASTSTVRLVGSSGANPYACIASGIASLSGPAHGGANEACLKMLEEIGHVNNIDQYIAKAKDKSDPFRLMGFGHRVYKNFDPRAKVMRETCHQVLNALKIEDPLLDVAMKLEDIALNDNYFIEKKLYPNVDFYSGIIMKAIGIPTSMFTVIFAISRTIGWITHWQEMVRDPNQKIGRPRQLYSGEVQKSYSDISQR